MMKKLLLFTAFVLSLCGCCSKPQNNAVEEAKKLIDSGDAECVLIRNGKIQIVEKGKGVSPLLRIYEEHKEQMKGAIIVDKVIGRAAAAIAINGKVKHVHAKIMSDDAAAFLAAHNITSSADMHVPRILNRNRSGLCPLEQSVENINDPQAALTALKNKIMSFKK